MEIKTYLVFHIVAYNQKVDTANGIDFTDKVVLRLIDSTLDSAIERAKGIIERTHYFLAEVVEYKEGK